MYPFVGWWLERGESTADLVRRARQQELFHFSALRRFDAALHCGTMGAGHLQSAGLGGEEKIPQAEKAPPAGVSYVAHDESCSRPKRESMGCLPGRYDARSSEGLVSSGRSSCYKSQLPFSQANQIR